MSNRRMTNRIRSLQADDRTFADTHRNFLFAQYLKRQPAQPDLHANAADS